VRERRDLVKQFSKMRHPPEGDGSQPSPDPPASAPPPDWVTPEDEQDVFKLLRCVTQIEALFQKLYPDVLEELDDVLGRNQNAGCGGDGTMTVAQWEYARDVLEAVERVRWRIGKFPPEMTPTLRDGGRGCFTQAERDVFDPDPDLLEFVDDSIPF
jgi:hypothetical protein